MANQQYKEASLANSLRVVGDQLLLQANDSTSRVLAIEAEDGVYTIGFEEELSIVPDSLVKLLKSTFEGQESLGRYLVKVISCDSNKVVYSYQMIQNDDRTIVNCKLRALPVACYKIQLIFRDSPPQALNTAQSEREMEPNTDWMYVFPLLGIALAIFIYYRRKTRTKEKTSRSIIRLGKFHFDPMDAKLILQEESIELSGKEAMLLELLHNSINRTVKREVILKEVWGDEGDYVGRTLDVFISKLRKKLSADPDVKIVNYRGVGYRLVVS